MLVKDDLITFDGLVETRTREHGGNNKRNRDNEEEDIVYEVSTQVSLVHGDRE